MFRILWLLISLVAFAYSLLQLADYWEYEEVPSNVEEKFKHNIQATQLTAEIERLIQNDDLDEARYTLELAHHFSYPLDYASYRQRIDKLDTFEHRTKKNITDFVDGFISGKGNNTVAIAGAVGSDFTVVGDARDLYKEYQKHQAGQEVDELIITLSGIGIGLTAATIGSGGTAAPVKIGTSVLKLASKTGRLSRRFTQELIIRAEKAFDWNQFIRLSQSASDLRGIKRAASQAFNPRAMKSLSELADQANHIRKLTSTSDAIYLLKYVETADDLRRIEKLASKQGKYTKGIMKFLGKSALRGTKILKRSIELFISLAGLVLSGIFVVYFMFPATKKANT